MSTWCGAGAAQQCQACPNHLKGITPCCAQHPPRVVSGLCSASWAHVRTPPARALSPLLALQWVGSTPSQPTSLGHGKGWDLFVPSLPTAPVLEAM